MDKFIKEREEQLEALKQQILETLKNENKDISAVLGDDGPKDEGDMANDLVDLTILQTLGNAELNRLKAIESALTRIRSGHYGNCLSCGEFLGKERLTAIPYAVLCIKCKSKNEKK